MIRYVAVLFAAIIVCQTSATIADDGPAKGIPELAALSNYVGTWDVAVTSQDTPFTKGRSTAKWILNGMFVEQTGELTSADGDTNLKIKMLMTYDRNEETYRMWTFDSYGTTSESTGKWDAEVRTMTSIRRGGGTTTTTTARFREDGIEEWSIVTKNQNNEVVGEISGRNDRRDN